jgi:hypothetical protein
MSFSLPSRTLLAFGLVLSVPLLTGANGNGCGGNVIIGNNGGSGTGGTVTSTCANSCGEAVPAIAQVCPDGISVGPVCGVTSSGCGWTWPCPTGPCTQADCGPLPPTPACPNGTSTTPVCGLNGSGACGWTIPPCSTNTCTPGDCGPEPGIEVNCNGVAVGPTCERSPDGSCGWIIPPCAVDAGTSCYKGSVSASSFDQSCTTAADCAAIFQGSLCGPCICPSTYINKNSLPTYYDDIAGFGGSPTTGCNCPFIGPPVCSNGVCLPQ